MEGWVKLHRIIIGSRIFKNDGLYKMSNYLIMMASHYTHDFFLGHETIHLERGQLITGEDRLGRDLTCSPSTARKRLLTLEKDGFCKRESKNKYSLITIANYDKYQNPEEKVREEVRTKKEQKKTYNNNKNEKNKECESPSLSGMPLRTQEETMTEQKSKSANLTTLKTCLPYKALSTFKQLYKAHTGLDYVGAQGADLKIIKELSADTPLYNQFFLWYNANTWWKEKGILPGLKLLRSKIDDVKGFVVVKPFQYKKLGE